MKYIRSELEVLPADKSEKKSLGWTMTETIGIGVVNVNAAKRMSVILRKFFKISSEET